jgi:hypothetical protein
VHFVISATYGPTDPTRAVLRVVARAERHPFSPTLRSLPLLY